MNHFVSLSFLESASLLRSVFCLFGEVFTAVAGLQSRKCKGGWLRCKWERLVVCLQLEWSVLLLGVESVGSEWESKAR